MNKDLEEVRERSREPPGTKKKKKVPGNSKCIGCKAKAWPAVLRNSQEASVAARKSE